VTVPVRIPVTVAGKRTAASKPATATTTLTALPPLSVYVHVPWCVRRCPYCDFNSHQVPAAGIPEAEYLAALRADLEQALPAIWGRTVQTVFIGGGTPSLLSAAAMDALLTLLRTHLNISPLAEITVEANPGTTESARLRDYAASGVNRISLGIQSFDDARLAALGRIHNARESRAAIAMAQAAVARVNLDVMFALPGQSLAACLDEVDTALSFGTEHLSLYQLTLEPNTVFAKHPPPALPDDDTAALMQEHIAARTADAGFAQYEVSAWARAGAQCQHNLNYWQFGDYLGLGPGAHGKVSFADRIERHARLRNPASWLAAAPRGDGSHIAETRTLHADELPFEFMLNALRLKAGVPARHYVERTGQSLLALAPKLNRASARGLLDADPTRLMATPLGWRFLNDLQQIFL